MQYTEAFEQQLQTLEWLHTPHGRAMCEMHTTEGIEKYAQRQGLRRDQYQDLLDRMDDNKKVIHPSAEDMWNGIRRTIWFGETYWWSPEMCDMLTASVSTVPNYTLHEQMMPSSQGYIWFARPFDVEVNPEWLDNPNEPWPGPVTKEDVHNWRTMYGGGGHGDRLLAISWSVMWAPKGLFEEDGTIKASKIHDAYYVPDIDADPETHEPATVFFVYWTATDVRANGDPVTIAYRKFGQPVFTRTGDVPNEAEAPGVFDHLLKITAAAIAFLNQELIQSVENRPNRAARRRWEGKIPPQKEPIVKIVRLRRKKYSQRPIDEVEHGTREYHCRWVVRGHWRNQWYPAKGVHMPKFIGSYVKGPEGLALKDPASNLFVVVR